jgi:hypothetical protein
MYRATVVYNLSVFLDYSFFALENGIFEYRNVDQIKLSQKQDLRVFLFNFSKQQICCPFNHFLLQGKPQ